MTTTIDRDGRIRLDAEVQRQLGVKPGDELSIENRNGQWVIAPVGLIRESGVLVHHGTSPVSAEDLLAELRGDRLDTLADGVPG